MCSSISFHAQVALCLVLLAPAFAEKSAHIRSKYSQLVASSTLQWVAGERGSYPENAVAGAHQITQGMLQCHCATRLQLT